MTIKLLFGSPRGNEIHSRLCTCHMGWLWVRAPQVQRLQRRPGLTRNAQPSHRFGPRIHSRILLASLTRAFSLYSRFLREAREKQYVSLFYYNTDDFILPRKDNNEFVKVQLRELPLIAGMRGILKAASCFLELFAAEWPCSPLPGPTCSSAAIPLVAGGG